MNSHPSQGGLESARLNTDPPAGDGPAVCRVCSSLPPEPGYALPLCSLCRDKLANRQLPPWFGVAGIVLVPILLFALLRFPASVAAGAAYERGQSAEARGDYVQAEADYAAALKRYPHSTLILARSSLAHYHAGHYRVAVEGLRQLEGREVSDDLVSELDAAVNDMAQHGHIQRSQGGPQ